MLKPVFLFVIQKHVKYTFLGVLKQIFWGPQGLFLTYTLVNLNRLSRFFSLKIKKKVFGVFGWFILKLFQAISRAYKFKYVNPKYMLVVIFVKTKVQWISR